MSIATSQVENRWVMSVVTECYHEEKGSWEALKEELVAWAWAWAQFKVTDHGHELGGEYSVPRMGDRQPRCKVARLQGM